eukprot:TRINITY_DN26616_c0_g2_i1.p1 TRINITY_DN26616_c0_g2~~TRINITY_DN26616_c0_g2_i1.p1  ORF type:complete len:280 (+),score=94.91 TRINITY_DN26616_c0_g2_i1:92-841(+)
MGNLSCCKAEAPGADTPPGWRAQAFWAAQKGTSCHAAYEQGLELYALGKVEAAMESFDEAARANRAAVPYLQMRGFARFHADEYELAAEQFAACLQAQPEPQLAIWLQLSKLALAAQQNGGRLPVHAKSAARMAPMPLDPVPEIALVQKLFQGDIDHSELRNMTTRTRDEAQHERPRWIFYIWMYLGLHDEFVARGMAAAQVAMTTALRQHYALEDNNDPMVTIAKVHATLRGWGKYLPEDPDVDDMYS